MTTYIYTLQDPISNEIRYVGKTDYLKQRLYAHIIECKTDRKTHKINWIKSLLENGLRPVISVLDEVESDEWEYWERFWIQQLNQWGLRLTNISSGGCSGNDYKRNIDTKEKMSKSKLGCTLTEEHKKNISDSVKLKAKENPLYNRGKGNSRIYLDKELLHQRYIIENLSLNKCAVLFNVSKKTVFTNITENGFKKSKGDWIGQLSTIEKSIICQYDLNGNFIKEWIGAKTIYRELGLNSGTILGCCSGRQNKAFGYVWRFIGGEINRPKDVSKQPKGVIQYDMEMNYINRFKSILESSRETSVTRSTIVYCCKGVNKSAGGFIWRYQVNI
jgi:hypothetical protein